ncbi:hypothetical protein Leryth_025110 [Lithospermum erythrorhizon]|nr:hypothetical protein Leryth_025110 [Lithospermum erythrorhizon]
MNYYILQHRIKRSEISTIIQGLLLGLLLFSSFLKFVHRDWGRQAGNGYHQLDVKRSLIFYVVLAMTLIVAVPSWMQFVQDFHMHPFLWIIGYVFSEPAKRLLFCICWVLAISVRIFYRISQEGKTERILLRKYYHLLAVLMFIPALLLQPELLNLALGAALAVFLVLEFLRIWRIWPLGQHVHHFMNAFKDHRDSDLLVISHFSLLLGCALPIWFSSGFNDRPLTPFAGILSLGIGDTMVRVLHHKYGVVRWTENKKTIEGTAAGITSVLVACSILLPYIARAGYIFSQHWFTLLVAVTFSGLLEALTTQLDNLFIQSPLFVNVDDHMTLHSESYKVDLGGCKFPAENVKVLNFKTSRDILRICCSLIYQHVQ